MNLKHRYLSFILLFTLIFLMASLCYAERNGRMATRLSVVLLEGSPIVPDAVRDKIISPYLDKTITFAELEIIRNGLTLWLVDNGFINSGVVIPDQEVDNGIIRMQVIEGSVTEITVSDTSSFSEDYFRSRLKMASEPPFNLFNLRDMLQLLQQDPQVRSINATLSAGARPGESALSVKVSEGRPWSAYILSSNNNSPATGSYGGEIGLSYRNAIGIGDLFSTRFGFTEGGYDMSASVSVPVTSSDTTIEPFYRRGEHRVIDPLFSKLDIKSESETFGGKLSHPVIKSTRREVRPSISFDHSESRNYLLGQGFSFSENETDGLSRLDVGRLGLEWLERGASYVFLLSTNASFSADSAKFLSWQSRLMWMQRTGWFDTRFMIRGDAQISERSLPSMEKFSLGGINSVRGFRKNLLVNDNALGGSFEYFFPLISGDQGSELLTLSSFFDYGRGWDNSPSKLNTSEQQIAGAGVGVKLTWKGLSADILYAYPVIKPDNHQIEDLQDRGFHFLVSWSL